MNKENIEIIYMPVLKNAICIIGFDGWGNALDVSRGMLEYLIRKLNVKPFGRLNPDSFYSYDKSRPTVEIKDGIIKNIEPPGGFFYYTTSEHVGRDILLIMVTEPSLRWNSFIDAILSICEKTGVKSIISLGSMYDNILHTDHIISGIASSSQAMEKLKEKDILPISYMGPSAIHSSLHNKAMDRGFESMSIWCHCPYYLQGTTHLGLLYHLGSCLSDWAGFEMDLEELQITWKDLSKQIQDAIDKNPEIEVLVKDLRKTRNRGMNKGPSSKDKIIRITDFLGKE